MAKKNIDLLNILRLIRTENVGPITYQILLEKYGDEKAVLEAIPELTKNRTKKLNIPSVASIEKEITETLKAGIKIITYKDDNYPPLLKKTEDFPPVLFVKGNIDLLKKSAIAIVGSRNCSLSGKQNAFNFAKALGEHGFLVVSGLAKGIDAAAHEGSLMKGTLAFLGGGVDTVYPKENALLYKKIEDFGTLVSEFPLGTKPKPSHFPRRNRLIAGMSRGVLVVEAGISSGSIITATIALDLGRDVFAIPSNPADRGSRGTNKLIKDGAYLTESPMDIIELTKHFSIREDLSEFDSNVKIMLPANNLTEVRTYLSNTLSLTPISVNILIKESKFSYADIQTAILEHELDGKIERFPGNKIAFINAIQI